MIRLADVDRPDRASDRAFNIHDMKRPHDPPETVLLENLGKEYYRLKFLVDTKSEHIRREERVSFEAGEIVSEIYEATSEGGGRGPGGPGGPGGGPGGRRGR